MKTVLKILILIFGVAQLIFVLYISLPSIPRRITNEIPGTMYTFGEISFNLTSDSYTEVKEIQEGMIERGIGPEKLMVLHDSNTSHSITFINNTYDYEHKTLIEQSIWIYRNPVNRFRVMLTSENINPIIYEGENKIAILNNTGSSYFLDFRIGEYYYTLIPNNQQENNSFALDNIMEFMRTVTLKSE